MQVVVREVDGGAGAICNDILRLPPTWFGIPEANRDSVDTAETHPGIVARVGEDDVGITTIKRHNPFASCWTGSRWASTRAFWLACGFRPLEELPTLWDVDNPALQLIKVVAQ